MLGTKWVKEDLHLRVMHINNAFKCHFNMSPLGDILTGLPTLVGENAFLVKYFKFHSCSRECGVLPFSQDSPCCKSWMMLYWI